MPPTCLYSIMELPDASLRRMLPKVSTRSLARLVCAYPRAVGRTFMDVLAQSISTHTLEFLRDELNRTQVPSYGQIREAESELLRVAIEEKLVEAQRS